MEKLTRYRFRFDELGLAGYLFRGQSRPTRGCAILCQGMPYVPCMEAIVPVLAKFGFDALQVQYPGTYDSAGKFAPKAVFQKIAGLGVSLARGNCPIDPRSEKPLRVQGNRLILVGHSFGSWITYQACLETDVFNYGLMFAPYFGFTEEHGVNSPEELIHHLKYVRRAVPLTHRFADDDDWDRLYCGVTADRSSRLRSKVVPLLGAIDGGLDKTRIRQWISSRDDERITPLQVFDEVGHGLEGFSSQKKMLELLREISNAP